MDERIAVAIVSSDALAPENADDRQSIQIIRRPHLCRIGIDTLLVAGVVRDDFGVDVDTHGKSLLYLASRNSRNRLAVPVKRGSQLARAMA